MIVIIVITYCHKKNIRFLIGIYPVLQIKKLAKISQFIKVINTEAKTEAGVKIFLHHYFPLIAI